MNKRIAKFGGISAVLSCVVFLFTIFYMFIILFNLGLTVEMLDTPSDFLPWLSEHSKMYNGFWWVFLLSSIFLIPVPISLYKRHKNLNSILPSIGLVVALIGIGFGILGPLFNVSTASILGNTYVSGEINVDQGNLQLLSILFGEIGLMIRLISELFISLGMGIYGFVLTRNYDHFHWLGWTNIGVTSFVLVAVVLKAWTSVDLEAITGFVLALSYLPIGFYLINYASADKTLKNNQISINS